MSERRRQGVSFLFLSLALSAFLMGHYLVVQVDFEACFENAAASINGDRPYRRVAEMSFSQLAYSAGQTISVDHLIVAILGLLPLSPFWIAWTNARDRPSQQLWIVSAIVAFIVIVSWTLTNDLTDFYDCDLNGVSIGILLAPIIYMAMTVAATLALALLQSLFLSDLGRE